MGNIIIKTISSLEKCFPDEKIGDKREINISSVLLGERFSFGIAYTLDSGNQTTAYVRVDADFSADIRVSDVRSVPVRMPTYPGVDDGKYLRLTPGLYPDLLVPVTPDTEVHFSSQALGALRVDVDVPEDALPGDHTVKINFYDRQTDETENGEPNLLASAEFTLSVIGAKLPDPDFRFTQWFHCDSLASYYDVPVFSEEHWRIIENFIRCAVRNGMDTILTPVFTPPLDTAVGKERPTVQLVDVYDDPRGWKFGFSRLDRWINLCDKCGIKYFEISHLFTQWGAAHAPKIMGWKDGKYVRLFGWDTDAISDGYAGFLRVFLIRLIEHLKTLGVDKNCFFHVSDEPNVNCVNSYASAKMSIADVLEGYPVIDALSDVQFYKSGLVKKPIPSINHLEAFIEAGVKDVWTYYCCGQHTDVTNRFIAMPLSRTRIIGAQFWKYDVKGFLQWGYNYWYTMGSQNKVNPFIENDAGYGVPAGDPFSVYPAPDGSAYESIRQCAFHEALQDLAALKLCESLYGREAVISLVDSVLDAGSGFSLFEYPTDGLHILMLREKVNRMIAAKVGGTV